METDTTFYDGNRILSFHPMDVPVVPSENLYIPLAGAMVVVRYEDQFLLVHTVKRRQWECPGGGIESDETPEQGAVREVLEESNQRLQEVACIGLVEFFIRSEDQVIFFALYSAWLDEVRPFLENSESDRMTLWCPGEVLDAPIGGLSQWMISQVTAKP